MQSEFISELISQADVDDAYQEIARLVDESRRVKERQKAKKAEDMLTQIESERKREEEIKKLLEELGKSERLRADREEESTALKKQVAR